MYWVHLSVLLIQLLLQTATVTELFCLYGRFVLVGGIVPDLHNAGVALIHQPEEQSTKQTNNNKKRLLTWSLVSKQPPQIPLQLSRSRSHSDLLSFPHPLLPHTSPLSLLHCERTIWGSVRSVCVHLTIRVPVPLWERLEHDAHQHLTNPLYIVTSLLMAGSKKKKPRNFSLKSEHFLFH